MQATEDLKLLIDAAHASGDIARTYFQADPEVWHKDGNAGPVTEADLEIDTMLRTDLLAARATYGWLSEETEDDEARLSHDRVFIVDPIDGTRAFIAGERHFSHSLAISENGRITTAVVYVPMMDLLFAATDSSAATLNGAPIAASSQSVVDGATVLATKPNMDPNNWVGSVPNIQRKFRPSLAYRLCLVAQGRYDAMLTLRDCWEWDIAAGDLIVRKAGGIVTDRHDSPLMFNSPHPKTKGCHAAGPNLHKALQAKIRQPEF
ncbi:3'(2'),5'-bisphosphate nucleotidase CysQ [Litoreibacter janthinus]|uniref:Myo-inositol-1(Or 4)-monophosphatase n=1 Tax=Litoreibacter janthinus TaxID=670154 RepID=A0A1I6G201_9RHOB|nr:3'(2'),5'-bisphosphate nucleotidase CysQ [Litoreibacter janthinus]SFR36224.1 myo-inositol-1(or 4)-monophosphatase [Litoreibacter janthinus]